MATSQHGVLAAWQLYGLDYSEYQVCNRATAGRLHRSHRGVYAVGRRRLSTKGRWLAAVCAVAPGFPLVARAVAPGFDFADLELG
ncbi:MAG: hypothetical protein M3018_02885 [Actinomycetota bacterium]|nr:hypothetical protein [Actinomycetota bacterium]